MAKYPILSLISEVDLKSYFDLHHDILHLVRLSDDELAFAEHVLRIYHLNPVAVKLASGLFTTILHRKFNGCRLSTMQTLFTMSEQVDLNKMDSDLLAQAGKIFGKSKVGIKMYLAFCSHLGHCLAQQAERDKDISVPNACLNIIYSHLDFNFDPIDLDILSVPLSDLSGNLLDETTSKLMTSIVSNPLFEVLTMFAFLF